MDSLIEAGMEMDRLHTEYARVLMPTAWNQEVRATRDSLVAKGRSIWRRLHKDYRMAKTKLTELCADAPPSSIDAQIQLMNGILAEQGQRTIFEDHQHLGERLFGEKWQSLTSDWEILAPIPQCVRQIRQATAAGMALPGINDFLSSGYPRAGLEEALAEAIESLSSHTTHLDEVQGFLDLDP